MSGMSLDFVSGVLCTLALTAAALGGRNLFRRKAADPAAETVPETEREEQPESAPETAAGNPDTGRTDAAPEAQPGTAEQEEDRIRSRASREREEAYRNFMDYSAEQAYGVKPGTRDFGTWNETGW